MLIFFRSSKPGTCTVHHGVVVEISLVNAGTTLTACCFVLMNTAAILRRWISRNRTHHRTPEFPLLPLRNCYESVRKEFHMLYCLSLTVSTSPQWRPLLFLILSLFPARHLRLELQSVSRVILLGKSVDFTNRAFLTSVALARTGSCVIYRL